MSDSTTDLPDLPDDVFAAIRPHLPPDAAVLSAIGVQIASKREEAKQARDFIESIWREADDAYNGVDDANRHESDPRWAKPSSIDGPLTSNKTKISDHRSTVYLRLTSRYVDAGVAKLAEILLPADEKSFSFDGMPVPALIEASEDDSHVVHSGLGVPLTRPVDAGETPPSQGISSAGAPPTAGQQTQPAAPPGLPPGISQGALQGALPIIGQRVGQSIEPGAPAAAAAPQSAAPPRVPLTVKDLAMERIELARKQAKAAETRIYDWMVETQYRAEIRKVIADAARIGVGVLKGPVPRSKKAMAVIVGKDGKPEFKRQEKIIPASVWVDPWDIFPDPACGENIHDGDYIFERDYMSARQVRALKKLPGYIGTQIDQVLEEGPGKVNTKSGAGSGGAAEQKGRFEVWYFYGQLTKDEMAAINHAAGVVSPGSDDDAHEGYGIVTLINDCVVRGTLSPLNSGDFPFHSMPWQRRAKSWAGVGVSEQMRTPQRIVNAALRRLLNNAGISAGSQIIIDQAGLVPADGKYEITPDKIWLKTNDGPVDVRQAFMAVEIPNMGKPLMEIITMCERFAEETTSIPLIAQGQSGATTPDTFGAAQLQNNNANQLLRSIGYAFDDYITEPVIRQYYEWLLIDPEVPNEEKGEYQIDAHGSSALVERAIQDQSIAQMGNMAANPIYGIDPKKWAKLFLRSKRLAPESVQYTEEEQAKMDANPPPEAPAVTAAKVAADTQIKLGVMKQTTEQQSVQAEGQIAAAAHVLEVGRAQIDQQKVHGDLTMQAHQLDQQNQQALVEQNNQLKINLDRAKAELAATAMKLQTERDLNAANQAVDLHKHHNPSPAPPVQVPGRAGNGRAFSQAPA